MPNQLTNHFGSSIEVRTTDRNVELKIGEVLLLGDDEIVLKIIPVNKLAPLPWEEKETK